MTEDEEQGSDREREDGIGVSAWYLSNSNSHNGHGTMITTDPEDSNEIAPTGAFQAQAGHVGHGGAGCVESSSDSEEDEEALFEEDTDRFMLRRREFRFPGLHSVLVLNQDFINVEGTGGAVWRPSIEFASFMCSSEGPRCLPLAGKSVLEISSGLGLGAIAAWHLGASLVVATDIDFEGGPMALLRLNVAANCIGIARTVATDNHQHTEQDGGSVREANGGVTKADQANRASPSSLPLVRELRWGDATQLADALSAFGGVGPDVVLACDVIFDEKLLPALMETVVGACALPTKTGTRPCLCISHQRRNKKREDRFFAELRERCKDRGRGAGGGVWQEVHREGDLSVYVMAYEMSSAGCDGF